MKRIIFIALLLFLFANNAYADAFQFVVQFYNDSAYAAYSDVKVFHPNGRLVFNGFTDKYGRLTINLENGRYDCIVTYRGRQISTLIFIDGDRGLEIVYLN